MKSGSKSSSSIRNSDQAKIEKIGLSRKLAGMEEREREMMRNEREREGRLRSYFMRLRPLDLLPSQKLKSKQFSQK